MSNKFELKLIIALLFMFIYNNVTKMFIYNNDINTSFHNICVYIEKID